MFYLDLLYVLLILQRAGPVLFNFKQTYFQSAVGQNCVKYNSHLGIF